MRFPSGGRTLERLAGAGGRAPGPRAPSRWRTIRVGADPWRATTVPDEAWLRKPGPARVREALQQGLLFPAVRAVARPRIVGADDLQHAPQPAVLAPNHASDLDTPLVLMALPRAWRVHTVVGAVSNRFYRDRRTAIMTSLWINTFPFDRGGGERRGLADAAEMLRSGHNVLLYPQSTRTAELEGFRLGVAELCLTTGTPLIPIHVGGSALLMPKGRGLNRRGSTIVAFGRPLYPSEDEVPAQLTERLSTAIAALAHRHQRRLI